MKLFDDDDLEAARAEGHAAGLAEGRKAGASPADVDAAYRRGVAAGAEVERDRIKSVLASPAAKTDPTMAARLALAPNVTAENLGKNLKHVAEARQAAADASWDEVIGKLNRERTLGGRQ